MSKYPIEDNVPFTSGRLDQFELGKMEIGQSFLIPFKTRSIGGVEKQVPEAGLNIKMANAAYGPKVFKKKRQADGVRIFRVE